VSELRFNIEKPGNVRLIILNLIGLKLDEFSAGYRKVGEHSIAWQPKFDLAGKVLNYRIELNRKVVEEKMFVVK
jgi:hypothetical protein